MGRGGRDGEREGKSEGEIRAVRGGGRDEKGILSRPKKPPSKILFPSWSFLFTHHVKLSNSF